MKRVRSGRNVLGSLHDDIAVSALRVHDMCTYETMTIWTDDRSNIRADPPDQVSHVPDYAIIGTYSLGIGVADIEADLAAERTERARWFRDES
jgi:hypothetical protein